MFERFSTRARRVVVLAQEEAGGLDHTYIGTEHILLGLIAEGQGPAARVLADFDVTLDSARAVVAAKIGRGESAPSGHIPFTPRAKKVLELSLREALELRQSYVGTGHILLAILRGGDGVAAQILAEIFAEQGTDAGQIRERIQQEFADDPGTEAGDPGGGFTGEAGDPRYPGDPVGIGLGRQPGPPAVVRWHQVIPLLDAIEARLTAIEEHVGITSEPPEDTGEPPDTSAAVE